MSKPKFLIQCLNERIGGSIISMADGDDLAFKPDQHGRHVATVEKEAHYTRLLAIPEGFKLLGSVAPLEDIGAPVAPVVAPVAAIVAPAEATATISAAELTQTVAIDTDAAAPLVATIEAFIAQQAAPATVTAPTEGDAAPVVADVVVSELENMPIEELRALFEKEVGRVAKPTTKAVTMASQIEAKRVERAKANQ